MDLSEKYLEICNIPVKGFSQVKISMADNISLQVTLGEGKLATIREIIFTVFRFISAHNAIFGKSSYHEFIIEMSSYHQCMKFQTLEGTYVVSEDRSKQSKHAT